MPCHRIHAGIAIAGIQKKVAGGGQDLTDLAMGIRRVEWLGVFHSGHTELFGFTLDKRNRPVYLNRRSAELFGTDYRPKLRSDAKAREGKQHDGEH
jgi:hypothetical protein